MKGRYKRRERGDVTAGLSPLPGQTAAGLSEPDSPEPGFTVQQGRGCKKGGRSEKVYLGVRVKMPVRDLLRNKRLAQGWEPQELQDTCSKRVKGEKKRVNTRSGGQSSKRKRPTKSLEELAIIVEVLEEDLKSTSTSPSPTQYLPSDPEHSPTGYYSDDSEDMIPSPPAHLPYSVAPADHQPLPTPPPDFTYGSHSRGRGAGGGDEDGEGKGVGEVGYENSSSFFWTQLQKEEIQLREISDAALLTTDQHHRTALHKVSCVGKRALGFAIAKRMAALNSLDLKDSDGMTALLHAANQNHHLMVADLICLGANVNETNNAGKSCLHLSAQKGYVPVLEVVKQLMMSGVYVNVEATDNSGMSVLQCASLALKDTVCELENSRSPGETRLQTLRREQMMETLECLLHMGSYLHTMGRQSLEPRLV